MLNVEINCSLSMVCSVAFFKGVMELLETAEDDAMLELRMRVVSKTETRSKAGGKQQAAATFGDMHRHAARVLEQDASVT